MCVCVLRFIKDSVTASRAGSRGRRMPGAPFTERPVEARGFRSPPRRAVRGDGWRWLGCPRLGKDAGFFSGEGGGGERVQAVGHTRIPGSAVFGPE